MDEDLRPKRGCFLTGVIVLTLLAGAWAIIYNTYKLISGSYEIYPGIALRPSNMIISIITSIITVIAMVLILRWKKLGAYIYGIESLISFAIAVFISPEISTLVLVMGIASLIVGLLISYFSYKVIVKREAFDAQE